MPDFWRQICLSETKMFLQKPLWKHRQFVCNPLRVEYRQINIAAG